MMSTVTSQATNEARLHDLGFTVEQARALADHVDICKVEALVLVRGCPLHLAARIAAYDSTATYLLGSFDAVRPQAQRGTRRA
jgi:hypothetical protein